MTEVEEMQKNATIEEETSEIIKESEDNMTGTPPDFQECGQEEEKQSRENNETHTEEVIVSSEQVLFIEKDETSTKAEQLLISEVSAEEEITGVISNDSEECVVARTMIIDGANGLPTNTDDMEALCQQNSNSLCKEKDAPIIEPPASDNVSPLGQNDDFLVPEEEPSGLPESDDDNDPPAEYPTINEIANFKCTDIYDQILDGLYDDDGEESDQNFETPGPAEDLSLSTATAAHTNKIPILHLANFKPASGCTNASDFIVRCFVARLRAGITAVKHGRSRWCKSRLRIFHIDDDRTLRWKPAMGEPNSRKNKPTTLDLSQCLEVRHAWEPDKQHTMLTGTATLRQKCEAANAHKSFALIFSQRTVDITAITTDQCKVLMDGFSALCFRLQAANTANHKTTDADAETETTKSTMNPVSMDFRQHAIAR